MSEKAKQVGAGKRPPQTTKTNSRGRAVFLDNEVRRVDAIRKLYVDGWRQSEIARYFGISAQIVYGSLKKDRNRLDKEREQRARETREEYIDGPQQ